MPHTALATLESHRSGSFGGLIWVFLRYAPNNLMAKISVEVPDELLADLDEHVGEGGKFVNRSEAVRASIRKTLDQLDDIDARHGRLEEER